MNAERLNGVNSTNAVIAAFDIGSNSIKMTLAWQSDGGIEEFGWRSETVRLGQGVAVTGSLAADRMSAGLDSLRRFSAFARQQGATRLIGVATEATRIAANGPAFLERVTSETGIELTSISGDREAELTFLGLNGLVDLSGSVVVADIGGGSTEIIIACDREIAYSRSYPIGSGRLTDQFVRADPPNAGELDACRAYAADLLAGAPFNLVRRPRLFITGGTGEYSFRMIPAGVRANAGTFDGLLREMTRISSAELAKRLSIAEARSRVLPAGIAVVRAVVELSQPNEMRAVQSGIRRGLLLAAFAGTL